jgi:DNA-binding response OmpR family regulator
MPSNVSRLDELIVVDANPEDYSSILAELVVRSARVHVFETGEEAVRTPGAQPSTLWMVNMRLPDMSGIGLLTLVRRRFRRCNLFLVGDFYKAEDELAARAAGATAYVCKPATAAWFDSYCLRAPRPMTRSLAKARPSVATTRPP